MSTSPSPMLPVCRPLLGLCLGLLCSPVASATDPAPVPGVDWSCSGGALPPHVVRCTSRGRRAAAPSARPGAPAMIAVAARADFDPAAPGAWEIPLFAPPADPQAVRYLLERVLCGDTRACRVELEPPATRLTALP
ncbi:MAG: hypothetical protein H6977_17735 [Gammaproteobacteria bacterium]|nr:hypothetical protein [Gammaproteobacteria bacterium]